MHLFRTLLSCSLTCKFQTKATNRKPFFKKIETKLESFEFDPKRKVIIVGDLTRTWIASVVTLKLKKKELRIIKDVMLANDLIDMWRIRHPDKKPFTWRQANSRIQRRLDY